MPVVINRTNNSFDSGWPITIPDRQIDTSATSLTLLGNFVVDYGAFVMEDLVRLLENFADTAPPSNPVTGQLWYSADPASPGSGTLLVYNGVSFVPVGGITVGSSFPPSPATGQLFYNPAFPYDLWIFDGSNWHSITGFHEATVDPSTLGSSHAYAGRFYFKTDTDQFFIYSKIKNQWVEILTGSGPSGPWDVGELVYTVNDNVSAAGTTQATATELDSVVNVVKTATSGSAEGVRMPTNVSVGSEMMVINATNVTIKIYPESGSKMDFLATDAPFSLGPKAKMRFMKTNSTQYYSFEAVYGA